MCTIIKSKLQKYKKSELFNNRAISDFQLKQLIIFSKLKN